MYGKAAILYIITHRMGIARRDIKYAEFSG